jgi:hypothetical protein
MMEGSIASSLRIGIGQDNSSEESEGGLASG